MLNVYADILPAGAVVAHLSGDHMECGYIDNSNRPAKFACLVVDGKISPVHADGDVDPTDVLPVVDGEIQLCGCERTFFPDRGELARIGVAD